MSTNSCWFTIVLPDTPNQISFPSGAILNITGIYLDMKETPTSQAPTGKITLYMNVNNSKNPIAIASFMVGRYDSAVTNILLGKNDSAILTTTGAKVPVKITGCLISYKGSSTTATKSPAKSTKSPAKQPTAAKKATPAATKPTSTKTAGKTPTTAKKAAGKPAPKKK